MGIEYIGVSGFHKHRLCSTSSAHSLPVAVSLRAGEIAEADLSELGRGVLYLTDGVIPVGMSGGETVRSCGLGFVF